MIIFQMLLLISEIFYNPQNSRGMERINRRTLGLKKSDMTVVEWNRLNGCTMIANESQERKVWSRTRKA